MPGRITLLFLSLSVISQFACSARKTGPIPMEKELTLPAGARGTAEKAPARLSPSPGKGPAGAAITILEFSDIQCFFCRRGYLNANQVVQAYPGMVRLVWKNFPLPFHGDAEGAAEAAHAAGRQGKFWEMIDLLFKNQHSLSRQDLEGYARLLGLDLDGFKRDLDSHRFLPRVKADMAEGRRLSVRGTPTFFINGQKLVGAQPLFKFRRIIDGILGAASGR